MEEYRMKKGGVNDPPKTPRPGPPSAIGHKEDIDIMRNRHKEEIKKLQDNCTHRVISDWIEEWWAPAHSTGYKVKVCRICGKVVERSFKMTVLNQTN